MGSSPVGAGAAADISGISGGAAKNASSGGGSGMGGASSAMDMKRGTAFPSASAGASALRSRTAAELLAKVRFTVIRGNLSEIACLAGMGSAAHGVDVSASDLGNDPIAVGKAAAEKYRCVVAVTGARDIVTDGKRVASAGNGVPQMGQVTGTGCMLSGVVGAYAAANADAFEGTVAAVASMGLAGEMAWEAAKEKGTGSLRTGIIDGLSRLTDREIGGKGKISYEAWD